MGYFPATTIQSSLWVSVSLWEDGFARCFVVQFGRAQTHFLEGERVRPQHLWVPRCQRLLSVPSAQLTEWIFHDSALSLSLDPQFACL